MAAIDRLALRVPETLCKNFLPIREMKAGRYSPGAWPSFLRPLGTTLGWLS